MRMRRRFYNPRRMARGQGLVPMVGLAVGVLLGVVLGTVMDDPEIRDKVKEFFGFKSAAEGSEDQPVTYDI